MARCQRAAWWCRAAAPSRFPAGTYALPCALIIGERTESTDRKTSLNAALRDFEVAA